MNATKINAISKAVNTVNRSRKLYAEYVINNREAAITVRDEAAAELYDILIADGFCPRVIGGAAGTLILQVKSD